MPPPKPRAKTPTYSVVVHEVPVKELLLALARDTKENIDIHPGLQGLVSLNAIDETLPAILDRISKQVNMRYRVEGKTIVVSPDTPVPQDVQGRLRQHDARHDLHHRGQRPDHAEAAAAVPRKRRAAAHRAPR